MIGTRYYREWCSVPMSRCGNMVPDDLLQQLKTYDPGYASVYLFREEDALEIRQSCSSVGLSRFVVASETLVVDLDDGDSSLPQVESILQKLGLRYDVWFSGGKGYHIYLYHEFIEDIRLPYSQRSWVEKNLPAVDLSIYQHGRILSLPGRIHPKTRIPKHFIKSEKGEKMKLELIEPPQNIFSFGGGSGLDPLASGLMRLSNMVTTPPYIGNRHTSIWGAALDLRNGGVDLDTCFNLTLKVNNTWQNPKSEDEVRQAVVQAYSTNVFET